MVFEGGNCIFTEFGVIRYRWKVWGKSCRGIRTLALPSARLSTNGRMAPVDNILTSFANDPNTGWGVYGAGAGQGVVSDGNGGWRVLIGQFAVPKGKVFTAAVRLAGDGIDVYAMVNSGVTTMP